MIGVPDKVSKWESQDILDEGLSSFARLVDWEGAPCPTSPIHWVHHVSPLRHGTHVSEARHGEPSQSTGELLNHQPQRGHF